LRALAVENLGREDDDMSEKSKQGVFLRMAQYIVEELKSCPGPRSRREVLEKLLNHNTIGHCCRSTTKEIFLFIENFISELQVVATGHSRDTLARKGAVSAGFQSLRSLSRVLQTNPSNISAALERRLGLDAPSFALLMKKNDQAYRSTLDIPCRRGGTNIQGSAQTRRM
jgi:hypothetical protein